MRRVAASEMGAPRITASAMKYWEPSKVRTGTPEPSYVVQNPHDLRWVLISDGELKWTTTRSDATPVSAECVDSILEEYPACLTAYAGHRVFEEGE